MNSVHNFFMCGCLYAGGAAFTAFGSVWDGWAWVGPKKARNCPFGFSFSGVGSSASNSWLESMPSSCKKWSVSDHCFSVLLCGCPGYCRKPCYISLTAEAGACIPAIARSLKNSPKACSPKIMATANVSSSPGCGSGFFLFTGLLSRVTI